MGDFDVSIRIRAVNLAKREFKKVRSNVQALTKSVKRFNEVGSRVQATGQRISSAGRSIAIAGALVIAPMVAATAAAANFETGLARVATLTEDTVPEALSKFGGAIKRLSVQTGKPLADLNAGLFQAISAGVPAGRAIEFLGVASKASVAGFTSVENAVTGLGRLFNAYGRNVDQTLKNSDQLFLANKFGVTTFGALASTIGTVAGQASVLKISSGELLAAFSTLTKLTGSTEEAATQLGAIFTAIKKPSEDAKTAISNINKTLSDADKIDFSFSGLQQQGLLPFLQKLQRGIGGSEIALNKIFGANIRASRGIASLTLNSELFVQIAKEMEQAGGASSITLEKFGDVTKTATERIRKLRQRFAVLITDLGGPFLDVIEKISPKIEKVISSVTNFVKANQKMVASILLTTAALGGLLVVLGTLGIALGGITTLIGVAIKIGPLFVGIAAAVKSLIISVSVLIGVFKGLGLVAALVVGFAGLIKAIFVGVIGGAIAFVLTGIVGFVKGFVNGFGEAFGVTNVFGSALEGLKKIAVSVFGFIKDAILGVVKAFGKFFRFAARVGKVFGKVTGKSVRFLLGIESPEGQQSKVNKIFEDVEKMRAKGAQATVKSTVKVEEQKTKGITDELKKRKAKIDALFKSSESSGGPSREVIDPFSIGPEIRRRGRNALSGAGGSGFGTRAIQGARHTPGKGGQTVNIDKIELPNVTDRESFTDEMLKLQQNSGQLNTAQLS